MSTEEFILVLKTCLLNDGLTTVVRSHIRLVVLLKDYRVVEVYLINDSIDGVVFTSCSEYEDLFRGICEGFRIDWKEAKDELPVEA